MIVSENQFFEYLNKRIIYNKWLHTSVARIKALGWLNNPTLNLFDIFAAIRNYYMDDIAEINSLRYFCDYLVGYNYKASEKKFLGKHYYWGILENSNDELDYLSTCNRFVCLMDKYFDYVWENSTYQAKETLIEVKECLCDFGTYYEDACLPVVDRHFTPPIEYVVFLEYYYINKLGSFLKKWIRTIRIRDILPRTSLIDKNYDDLFLTFNYTAVLKTVYNIKTINVIHVHGSLRNYTGDPIIGHGNKKRIDAIQDKINEAELLFDEKWCSICKTVKDYYVQTFKDTNRYLNRLSVISKKMIEDIVIIGHSLDGVDMP